MIRTIVWSTTYVALAWPQCWCEIRCGAVVNSASFQFQIPAGVSPLNPQYSVYQGIPSGGSLATVFCSGIRTKAGTYAADPGGPLSGQLGGISISVNGAHA